MLHISHERGILLAGLSLHVPLALSDAQPSGLPRLLRRRQGRSKGLEHEIHVIQLPWGSVLDRSPVLDVSNLPQSEAERRPTLCGVAPCLKDRKQSRLGQVFTLAMLTDEQREDVKKKVMEEAPDLRQNQCVLMLRSCEAQQPSPCLSLVVSPVSLQESVRLR